MWNLNNVRRLTEHSLSSQLNFGKYKGETIKNIFTYDSNYIIYLYDTNAISPNRGLLELIHKTRDEIIQRAIKTNNDIYFREEH